MLAMLYVRVIIRKIRIVSCIDRIENLWYSRGKAAHRKGSTVTLQEALDKTINTVVLCDGDNYLAEGDWGSAKELVDYAYSIGATHINVAVGNDDLDFSLAEVYLFYSCQ